MKQVLGVTLGILTAIGGFLDVGAFATAGQAGAKFGLGLVWALLLGTLCIILLLTMVGRLTAVAGKPYASAIREHFGFKFFLLPLLSELIANVIMLAAEIGGVAIALSLFTGLSWHLLYPVAALLVFVMVWRAPFDLIENGPALLGLVTLGFVVAVFASGGLTGNLAQTAWKPDVRPAETVEYFFLAAAILGAIISPYLIYFYSSGAREEHWSRRSLGTNRLTAILGMSFGSVTALSVVTVSAIVLKPMHIQAGTLPEIGLGLVAVWGKLGGLLFALSLLVACYGAALEITLAVPYMVAQGFGWQLGENRRPVEAPRFNLVMIVFLLSATGLGLLGVDPLKLTIFGSALTALLLPVSLFPFLVLMNDRAYLRDKTNGPVLNVATIVILALAALVALVSMPLLLLAGGG
jgi:Mn2+/Fe2+ NRAMP family transporter